jgi:uncharacterized membrane protein YhaH (DUF805 family)
MLIPGILYGLTLIIAVPILLSVLSWIIGGFMWNSGGSLLYVILIWWSITIVLTQLLYLIIFYKTWINTITKRCRDFGSDGQKAIMIFKAQIITTLISVVLTIITIIVIILNPNTLDLLQTINSKYGIVLQIINVLTFIMGIFLLFRPGNKWDNQFGKDPINTKVSFLG